MYYIFLTHLYTSVYTYVISISWLLQMNTEMDMGVFSVPSHKCPKWNCYHIVCIFDFWGTSILFFSIMATPVHSPRNVHWGPCSAYLPVLIISCLIDHCYSSRYVKYFTVVLSYVYLIIWCWEFFIICDSVFLLSKWMWFLFSK